MKDSNETKEQAAAALVKDAKYTAKDVLDVAERVASELAEKTASKNDVVTKALSDALREVFNENLDSKRFVDVTRIPLICQSIVELHKNIEKINDNIVWIVRLVIGGVIAALLMLVLK